MGSLCCFQSEPDRVKIQTDPKDRSFGPPTSASDPSADSATLVPNSLLSPPRLPVILTWDFPRSMSQAAPFRELSAGPPVSTVLPSRERATLAPNRLLPTLFGAPNTPAAFQRVPDF